MRGPYSSEEDTAEPGPHTSPGPTTRGIVHLFTVCGVLLVVRQSERDDGGGIGPIVQWYDISSLSSINTETSLASLVHHVL